MSHSFTCISGSIHQGSNEFGTLSRGRQCSFMVLSALLRNKSHTCDLWNSAVIDQILLYGDQIFVEALENGQIPDHEQLSVNVLPNTLYSPIDNCIGHTYKKSCISCNRKVIPSPD